MSDSDPTAPTPMADIPEEPDHDAPAGTIAEAITEALLLDEDEPDIDEATEADDEGDSGAP